MSHSLISGSFDTLYRDILQLLDQDYTYKDQGSPPWKPDDNQGYKEILGLTFELTDPENNRVLSESRNVDYDYAEMFFDHLMAGTYAGPTMEKILEYKPASKMFISTKGIPGQYSTQYGPKMKEQLPRVVELLKADPASRRAVIHILIPEDKQIWDVSTRHEYPCCSQLQLFIRDNRLNLMANFRSNNMFKTVCYDVYLLTSWLFSIWDEHFRGYELGSYIQQNASSHFFGSEQEGVTAVLEETVEQIF